MEENYWKCRCGNINAGRFCSACGREREVARENSWTCECGKVNTGRFCSACGRERKLADYVMPVAEMYDEEEGGGGMRSVNEIRKWSGSWIVLVLSVLFSVTFLCSFISFCLKFKFGFSISMIFDIIGLIPGLLVMIGFWKSFASGKNKSGRYSSGGPRILRGMLVFYQVIAYIILSLILLLLILVIAMGSSFGDIISDAAGQMGIDVSAFAAAGTAVLVGIIIGVAIAFTLVILFFTFARRFARTAILRLDGTSNEYKSATPVAVFFFIMGICSLLSAIMSVMPIPVFDEMLGQIGLDGILSTFMGAGGWLNIISGFAGALTFIFAGVLAVSFNGAQRRAQM